MSKVALAFVINVIFLNFYACIPASRRLPTELREVSGAELCPTGGYFLINDSGNTPTLFEYEDKTLKASRELAIPNVDWEALASLNESLVICDIGDNRRKRKEVDFYILGSDDSIIKISKAYPDSPENAEGAFAFNDKLYVLTKASVRKKGKQKTAYLYDTDLASADKNMLLIDSLILPNRVVTGATMIDAQTLGIVAYDFDKAWIFPYTKTSVFTIELNEAGGFRQNTLLET